MLKLKIRFLKYLSIFLCLVSYNYSLSQKIDSAYIKNYPKKMWISGYVSTKVLQVEYDKQRLLPNNPINMGIGIGIRNTIVNISAGHSIIPLKGDKYGKTKALDFQIHKYGRHYIADFYYQNYKGFYQEKKKIIKLYPQLSVRQIGAEGIYIFNGTKFSTKAAFEKSEVQRLSIGSFLLGGALYWQHISPDPNFDIADKEPFKNFQIGFNGGYAYSWVLNNHWLWSNTATVGANFGNQTKRLEKKQFKIYPTAFFRTACVYHKSDWSVSFGVLINHKIAYPVSGKPYELTSLNMQLSYVKQIDYIFKKKKSKEAIDS